MEPPDRPDQMRLRLQSPTDPGGGSMISPVSSTGAGAARLRAATSNSPSMSDLSIESDLERHTTELQRIATHQTQRDVTVGRGLTPPRRIEELMRRRPLPAFGAGKPYPPPLPDHEAYVVEFDGPDDPLHAQNWAPRKKILTATILAFTAMTASFASSVFSPATGMVSAQYGVGTEVGTLGLSIYVVGFAFGPSIWAPLSELRGRRLPILVSALGFTLFSAGCAAAGDVQTVMLCRFFSGFFGACPLAVVAAVFSDMFDSRSRGVALTLFSVAIFTGPFLAGPAGGYVAGDPHLGWRWTEWLVAIMGAASLVAVVFGLDETYAPQILVTKAASLRRRTLNWGIHAKQEEVEIELGEVVRTNLSRPLLLLFTEPAVLLMSVYGSFVYGLLYLFLAAYPITFERVHGFSAGEAGLTFLAVVAGELLAGLAVILSQPWYERKLAANGGVSVPEWRLPIVIVGGVAFSAGIFWFGWTAYRPGVHWMVPTSSGVLTGFGLMAIFLQMTNYLVDAYLLFAASVLAGNILMRSLCGAAFPLFAGYMFESMGVQWAATLLGCVAAALVPIPILFYRYGSRIRQRSRFIAFAPTPTSTVSADHEAADPSEIKMARLAGVVVTKADCGEAEPRRRRWPSAGLPMQPMV